MSFAQVILLGHVGQDPAMSYNPEGVAFTRFTLATNRKVKDQDLTTWWSCTAFRGLAETINTYVHKGDMVFVTGVPSVREYTKRDGSQGYSLDVVLDKFAFAGGRRPSEVTRIQEEALSDEPEGEPPPF